MKNREEIRVRGDGLRMKIALIRLEDVGPGGYYETAENQVKLVAVTDHLYRQGVPFQVAVIPRFVDPSRGIDRSMADVSDPVSVGYLRMLRALAARGASLGIHGCTHQFAQSVSGEGNEFYEADCTANCPPDDVRDTLTNHTKFTQSYAYRRLTMALTQFHAAGLRPDWFETPHYTASPTQRSILEACNRLIYEDNPADPRSRTITYRAPATPFSRGTFYVPTPLGYVNGASVDQDVQRISEEMRQYGEEELASFFFHPFLEFPFITLQKDAPPIYSEYSPLKRLIRNFKADGRRFRSILHLFPL
ncbi:MAG: hypothetical protein JWR03_1947 [Cohnella sp.]|nr:hypothetical protein [Cohnella sp.]